jgi:flagellin-like protein
MKITKMLRSRKGLSPIFAILILIAIAVIAGIVVYMFTSGTIATMTGGGTAGQEKVAIQAVEYTAGPPIALTVWSKSTGGTQVLIDGAIIKDSGGATIEVVATVAGTLPQTGTLTGVNVPLAAVLPGGSYTVTLTSIEGGSFVSASFEP